MPQNLSWNNDVLCSRRSRLTLTLTLILILILTLTLRIRIAVYPTLNLILTITSIGGVALQPPPAVGQDPAHHLGEDMKSHGLSLPLRHRLLEGRTTLQRPLVLVSRTSDGAVIHLRLVVRENDLLM